MRKNRRNSVNLLNCRYLGNLLHNLDDWHLHIDWHLNHLLLDDWLLRRVAPPARPRVVLFQKPRNFSKRDKQSCLLSLPAGSSVRRRLAGPLARAARLRPVPGPWRTPPCHASEERGRAGAARASSCAIRANLLLCIQQKCQYYRGVIGESRDPAFYAEPKDAILQGLHKEKSCPGPFVYSRSVNITGAL